MSVHVRPGGGPRRQYRRVALAMVVLLTLTGCFKSATDQIKGALNSAIADVDQQSSNWQDILTGLESKLDGLGAQAHDALTQVQQLLTASVQVAGQEGRCTIDFVGRRVSAELSAIRDSFEGKTPAAPTPTICSTNPNGDVVLKDVQSGVTHEVDVSGYNLSSAAVQWSVRRRTGSLVTVDPQYVASASQYALNLNVSAANGFHFPADAQTLVLSAQGTTLATLNVEDVPAPPPAPPAIKAVDNYVVFSTADDDKDDDSILSVSVVDRHGVEVLAYHQDGDDLFDNNSVRTVKLAPFTILESELKSAKLTICIAPNGNDTWRFSYQLLGSLSNGSSYKVTANSIELDQDNRCYAQAFSVG